jgi:Antitoxin Phd_YefM, type II toxin-antitoxin system
MLRPREHSYTRCMARLSLSQSELPEIVTRTAKTKERTILSHRGKDVAALVPMEDVRLLERLTQQEIDRRDLADARKALAERGRRLPLRDFLRQLGE